MIKNVILDVAGVLIDFPWRERFVELGVPKERVDYFEQLTFSSKEWVEFDRGVWSDEEVLNGILSHTKDEDKEQIRIIWDKISGAVKQREYARPWIQFLRKNGFQVYLLSNYPGKVFDEQKEQMSFEEDVDGAIFSYRVRKIKPEQDIYEEVLNRFGLRPEESVFIDDTAINLPMPKSMGIHTIQFRTFEQVQKELKELGVPEFI